MCIVLLVADDHSTWPPPSESRRVRICLYLGEGLIAGGGAAAILLFPILNLLHFFTGNRPGISTTMAVIIVLFGIAFIHSKLPILIAVLSDTCPKPSRFI